MIFEKPEYFEN